MTKIIIPRAAAIHKHIIGTNILTKFHKDRKINVASRENAPPPGSHVFQPTGIIFELVQDIIGMDLLTKFHEDWTINVASRVLTRFYYSHIKPYKEKCPASGGHVFQATKTIFKLIQDIIGTNLLTKVLTRKIAPPPWWPCIIGMNLLTKKNAPPLGSHVFQANVTVFKLIQDIIKTNLLTIFHQDWTINVASRVLRKNAPPPDGHVFQPTSIIFKLVQDIIGMNLLTKFHEVRTINVASRVLTRFYYSHIYSHIRKKAPPLGSHVFQAKNTIFELIQDISGTNLLSKFHEDRKINVASRVLTRKNAPPPGGHVFQPTGIIFELFQDIIGMNLLIKFYKFYEEQTINVASRVKNAPPLGSHVFQANVTLFELIQDIIETNLLTKFHEDWTINVASRELTRQMLTLHNGQRMTDKKRSQKLTMRTLCSGELIK
ncbi:hypothetical protein DPMN_008565 [Dreissena polymorpha]|uniref:Uncharacterized protein n=1 Tax=Dreissena polymorpha TaxID=45954 RepID=A0A9D4RZT0_DREPO|nr:hypothetical protein DPMN_008565 [Dreissena polymorpha]